MLVLLFGAALHAQSVNGSLTGTVKDSTGAVIQDAKVGIVNESTGAAYSAETTSAGIFRFPDVALGNYTVTANYAGFKGSVTKSVLIQIETVAVLNIVLQPGAQTEQITVTAEGPSMESESSEVGGVISSRQIDELPLALGGVGALRSSEAFIFLQPATTGPGTANSANGIFLSKVAGGQNYGNEVLIDGASQERSENGSSFDEEGPSVEALSEFKVTTSLPEAEFGRTTGGIENFVTKSGSNQFHGTAYELFKNTALDANTYFNKGWEAYYCTGANNTAACRATYTTPVDRKNDFGGTFGGPLRIPKLYKGRDKTFGFFSWEQFKQSTGGTNTVTVPTSQELAGNFSDRLTNNVVGHNDCFAAADPNYKIYGGEIFDPASTKTVATPSGSKECRTPFANNTITKISSVAKALVSFYPTPTNNNVTGNFTYKGSAPITDTTYSIRIDHDFSEKLKVWGSYNTRDNDLFTGGLPTLPGPANPNGWWQNFTTHFFRVGADYTITPNLLNYVVLGSNRSNSQNYSSAIVAGGNWFQKLGLANAAGINFPQINTGDAQSQLGSGQNDDNVDNGLRLNDAMVWTHGHHSFKAGVDIRYQQYSPINGRNEVISFSGSQTAGESGQGGGLGFASLMLGEATGGNANNVVVRGPRWTSWYYAAFLQDDFKVTNNLTLNLGLRYDLDQPRHEAHNLTSNFSPTAIDPEYNIPGALVFGSTCGGCNTAWANTWKKDFGPRAGFAWSPDLLHQKTVIRGGAGILYGALVYDDFGGSMNTGYTANTSANSPNGFDPSFQIDNGMPAFTPPPDLDAGYFNGQPVAGAYITPTAGRPTTLYSWNLQVQHQLADDLVLTVGYIGNHAQNLESNLLNPNNIPVKDFALGDALYSGINGNNVGVTVPFPGFLQLFGGNPWMESALRPFPQYDYIDQGCCLQNVGMSSFNALTASVQRHFHQGMNLQASYTWGKTITDADSALPNHGVGVAQDMNTDNLHYEKAISAQDLRHTLVISGIYELPAGKGKPFFNHGIAAQILGGWEVGTVQRIQSGQPISFCCATGPPGFQNAWRFNKLPGGASLKSAAYKRGGNKINPFVVLSPGQYSDPNSNSMFNMEYNNVTQANSSAAGRPVAFYDVNANYARDCTTASLVNCKGSPNQPYQFADNSIPRVTSEVRTPPYFNNDMSIIKRVTLREGYVLSLKGEFLNTFNEHTWTIPDTNPYDAGFGIPGGTVNGPRNVQVTARFTF